jgi:hypothetical protein
VGRSTEYGVAASGFEHDGFAKQTREEWLDDHGRKMLRRSARLAAKKSAKYGIPVRRLTVDELRAKRKGFAGHRDVSEAFRKSDQFRPRRGLSLGLVPDSRASLPLALLRIQNHRRRPSSLRLGISRLAVEPVDELDDLGVDSWRERRFAAHLDETRPSKHLR